MFKQWKDWRKIFLTEKVIKKKTPKVYNLEQEDIDILQEVMKEYGYRTQVQAVRHVIQSYKKLQNEEVHSRMVAEQILNVFAEQYKDYWKRLYSSVRATDKNASIMLDVLNTILIENDYEACIFTDVFPSPVIDGSREHLKKKIGKVKQKVDRKRRNNNLEKN